MKKFYTLEIELWHESREAREEAYKILHQESIDKTNMLLIKYRKGIIATMESSSYAIISMAYKMYCKYFQKQSKALIVPVITLVIEANQDTEPEDFVKLQKDLETSTALFHRFMFYVNDEEINEKNEVKNDQTRTNDYDSSGGKGCG